MTIKIYQVSSYDDLNDIAPYKIEQDWYNQNTPLVFFKLGISNQSLFFNAVVQKKSNCFKHPKSTFIEGLWQKDCAEIFLANNAEYQESNFSPDTAWWTGKFIEYRVSDPSYLPNKSLPEFTPGIEAKTDNQQWEIRVVLPLTHLIKFTKINICFVLANEINEVLYLSYTKLPSKTPDFHQFQDFSDFKIIQQTSTKKVT